MGTIYRFVCPCGYGSDDLFVGVGFAGPKYEQLLGMCTKCCILKTVDANFSVDATGEPNCQKCGNPITLLAEPSEGNEWRIRCPNCAAIRPLEQTGCWD